MADTGASPAVAVPARHRPPLSAHLSRPVKETPCPAPVVPRSPARVLRAGSTGWGHPPRNRRTEGRRRRNRRIGVRRAESAGLWNRRIGVRWPLEPPDRGPLRGVRWRAGSGSAARGPLAFGTAGSGSARSESADSEPPDAGPPTRAAGCGSADSGTAGAVPAGAVQGGAALGVPHWSPERLAPSSPGGFYSSASSCR